MFYNKFSLRTLGEGGACSLLKKEKHGSAKSNVLEVLFLDKGKISDTVHLYRKCLQVTC